MEIRTKKLKIKQTIAAQSDFIGGALETITLYVIRFFNSTNWVAATRSPWVLTCFLLGHFFTLLQATLWPVIWLAVATVILALLQCRYRCLRSVLGFSLGLFLATLTFQQQLDAEFPSEWERKEFTVIARVVELPKQHGSNIGFKIKVLSQQSSPELDTIVGQKMQLSCYRCPYRIESNQLWHFTLRVKRPHGYASNGVFDYEKYLFKHNIVAKGYVHLKSPNRLLNSGVVDHNNGRVYVKQQLLQTLNAAKVGTSIILALSIGDKSNFTNSQRDTLQKTGLSHLFAISGLHIGLIYVSALFVFKWCWNVVTYVAPRLYEKCPRQFLCVLPALLCAIAYAAMAGFAVSTQRAIIMLAVFVLSRFLLRECSLMNVLIMAASLLMLYDPFSILDIGFWLSCGAVFVIAVVTQNKPDIGLLQLQPALWMGMMPLSILFFGQISVVSPFMNLIAVPLFCLILIPFTLLCVLINIADLPYLSYVSTQCLVWMSHVFTYIYNCAEYVADLPIAAWDVPSFKLYQWGAFVLIFAAYRWYKRVFKYACVLCFAMMLWPSLSTLWFNDQPNDDYLKVTLLDVGQGLSMVIQTEHGVTVYDTGPRYQSGFSAAKAVLLPYLKDQGIQRIDRLIISHADNDHIGGYETVIDKTEVGQVLTSRVDKLPDATECHAGQQWREGVTVFTVISPEQATPNGSNNRSCVLRVDHPSGALLISGDIEKQVEAWLLKRNAHLSADVLLVPHQGSKTSSTPAFLNAVKPSIAIVAAGYLNQYNHPHDVVMQRYKDRRIPVLSTVDLGSIELSFTDSDIQISAYREKHPRFWAWAAR